MAPKPRPSPRKRKSAGPIEQVARAAGALRRGAPVAVTGPGGVAIALAVETASDEGLAALAKGAGKLRLLLTHARAATLKIRLYTPDVVVLPLKSPIKADELRAIADPTFDLASPLKGPFEALREKLPASFAAAVKLAKLGGLLPSVVVRGTSKVPRGMTAIPASAIAAYDEEAVRTLALVTRARVPLEGAEKSEMAVFRSGDGGPEHYAIIVNTPTTRKPVLARVHSECFTGDLLASLKCDCGSQLRGAIDAIQKAGGGILLYLAQEGRGIGLINKLRAYRLQDQGFDTHEANIRLGFEVDERLYGIAARMLELLGYRSVRLLTNNPAKVAGLKAAGVKVVARVPHAVPSNDHNRTYLATKAKAGHLL
jgi:GTP cyclohydrolase II